MIGPKNFHTSQKTPKTNSIFKPPYFMHFHAAADKMLDPIPGIAKKAFLIGSILSVFSNSSTGV